MGMRLLVCFIALMLANASIAIMYRGDMPTNLSIFQFGIITFYQGVALIAAWVALRTEL